MAVDLNQRKRHRILDTLFREEKGYSVAELVVKLLDDYDLDVSERTIKSDIKTFKEEYKVAFDESLPKDGRAIRYRYADRNLSVFDRVLTDEDKKVLADLLGRVREYGVNPNYSFFLSLLEHVVTHQSAKDIELDTVQFANNDFLKGIDEWFRPLLSAITNKQVLTIEYHPFGKHPRDYVISPYLLKQFNDRWFLVARIGTCPFLSTFAIDRIESVNASDSADYVLEDIQEISQRFLSVYGVTGAFDKEPDVADIVMKVVSSRIGYIDTKPISPLQVIEEIPDCPGWYRLTIPGLVINKELVSLLLSFGSDVEILAPLSLREEIGRIASSIVSLYTVK